ncbi:RN150 protein, partial [Polypterus senegalus]
MQDFRHTRKCCQNLIEEHLEHFRVRYKRSSLTPLGEPELGRRRPELVRRGVEVAEEEDRKERERTVSICGPNADCTDDIPQDYEGSIGGPSTNQITGSSDLTVNESSVILDPAIRTIGLPQVFQDGDTSPQLGEVNNLTNNDNDPAVSSDSDTSLILAVEVGLSDVELSTDQDCEEVKS